MKRLYLLSCLALLFAACTRDRFPAPEPLAPPVEPGDRTVVHYWNFNTGGNFTSIIQPTTTIGGASLSYTATGDPVGDGTTINAQNNDIAGSALRLRNPAGVFTMSLPTLNCTDVLLRFAVMRTANGAQENLISYTIDGTNFITAGLTRTVLPVSETWALCSVDFSSVPGVNNNPNFKVRIEFRRGNTNESGNNRYDNIVLFAHRTVPPVNPVKLLHYWNFNGTTDVTTTIGGASWLFATAGSNTVDNAVDGTTINARNNDPAGSALRLRETRGGLFTISAPTPSYEKIRLSFAVTSTTSANAPLGGTISYTVDGLNYTDNGLASKSFTIVTRETFQQESFDFSGISGVNNNPNFKIRISFTMPTPDANAGNLRVDNISIEGELNPDLPPPPPPASADPVLMHYWNFNDNTNPTYTVGGAQWAFTTTGVVNVDNGVAGTDINAQNGDAAGNALRLRETKAGEFTMTLPTGGYSKVKLSFAATSTTSASAPQGGTVSYSLDGSTFIETGLTNPAFTIATRETFQQETFDFSNITGTNNNPLFKVKIKFTMPTPDANAGNLRVDNITLKGVKD